MIEMLIGIIIALIIVSIALWVVAGIVEDRIDKEYSDNGSFDK